MESSIYQPSESTSVPPYEKLTLEEQGKKNRKIPRFDQQRLTLLLAAVVGVFLLVSNIVLLAFVVRVATDVKEVNNRVDRLHVPCSECSVPRTTTQTSVHSEESTFHGNSIDSLTTRLPDEVDRKNVSPEPSDTPVESWSRCSTTQQMIHLQETVDDIFEQTKLHKSKAERLASNADLLTIQKEIREMKDKDVIEGQQLLAIAGNTEALRYELKDITIAIGNITNFTEFSMSNLIERGRNDTDELHSNILAIHDQLQSVTSDAKEFYPVVIESLRRVSEKTDIATGRLEEISTSLIKNKLKSEIASEEMLGILQISLKELESNLTSAIEISNNDQREFVLSIFRKTVKDHLNFTECIDALETELKNFTIGVDHMANLTESTINTLVEQGRKHKNEFYLDLSSINHNLQRMTRENEDYHHVVLGHLKNTSQQTNTALEHLDDIINSLTNSTLASAKKFEDVVDIVQISLKDLEANVTSTNENCSLKQYTMISNLHKTVGDHLNYAVDVFQSSLTDVEINLTSAIEISKKEQETVLSRSMNTLDTLLNTTISLKQAHTPECSKEQSEYFKDVMHNLTNTVHGLLGRIEQDRTYRRVNLKMCIQGKPCQIIDKTRTGQLCFKLSTEKATWTVARQRCESMGGNLAEVTDSDIHNFVKSIIKESTWIGGTDRGHEGQWSWDHSGAEVRFTAWGSGQPDNYRNNEHCMHTSPTSWNDAPCSYKYVFLCEKADTNCDSW